MSLRRFALLVLLTLALAIAVFGHPWRRAQAALLVAGVAAAGRDSPWKWITDTPHKP